MEESKLCSSCKKYISAANFTSHSAFCQRNFKICDMCGESIYRDLIAEHEEECRKRLVFCEFCYKNLTLQKFAEHIDLCESRTEICSLCSEYVMLKHKKKHSEFHLRGEEIFRKNNHEADLNGVNNYVPQEPKNIQENYLNGHFTHSAASVFRKTTQNGFHNGGENYDLPHNEANNLYPRQSFPRNNQQVNHSMASASSAQFPRKQLHFSKFNHLYKSGNEETPTTNAKYPFAHHSADGMSGGSLQNGLFNGGENYDLPPDLNGVTNHLLPLPSYIANTHFKPSLTSAFSSPSSGRQLYRSLHKQKGQTINKNPYFLSKPESDSPEDYFQCHLCCENILEEDKDMHLSSTCKMLQEEIPSDFYECPLCNEIMPHKDKSVHDLFECKVMIEANQELSTYGSNSEDDIHFLGMKTNGKVTTQENIPGNSPNVMMQNYLRSEFQRQICKHSAELQKEKNKMMKKSKKATENCPTCNKVFKLLDYHLHFPSCGGTSQKASSHGEIAQCFQNEKQEVARTAARTKFEQTMQSLTSDFCKERKMVEKSKNEKKHSSDLNEFGNGLQAKQPCKMKLGNYPIFSVGEQTADSFGESLASASTSRGINHGKETNTFSDNAEAKGSSDDEGLWQEVKLPRCIICTMNDRNIVFQPCGHLVVCSNCANPRMKTCPVCRQHIRSRLKTYIS